MRPWPEKLSSLFEDLEQRLPMAAAEERDWGQYEEGLRWSHKGPPHTRVRGSDKAQGVGSGLSDDRPDCAIVPHFRFWTPMIALNRNDTQESCDFVGLFEHPAEPQAQSNDEEEEETMGKLRSTASA